MVLVGSHNVVLMWHSNVIYVPEEHLFSINVASMHRGFTGGEVD
jgi:hypothetical protein